MSSPTSTTSANAGQLTYQQLDSLHVLRGICAFYVVIYHAKYVLWSGGTEYLRMFPRAGWKLADYLGFGTAMTTSAGYEMVIFFFVLSGFFIRYATLRRPRPTLQFYLNRAVRIYPPYLASLLLAAAVLIGLATWRPGLLSATLGRELNASLLAAWQELSGQPGRVVGKSLLFMSLGTFYLGYNLVYWSLLPEAVFYLLVPLVFRQARWYYVASAVLFVVGSLMQARHWEISIFAEYALMYNAYFALGSWLYDLLVARPKVGQLLGRTNATFLVLVLVGLLVAINGLSILHLRFLSAPLAAVLAVLSILVLLAQRVNPRNLLVRLFHNIGLFSFSLYLYHFPLLLLCYALFTAATGQLFSYGHWYWLVVPVVTLGAYGLYWVTERLAVRYFRGV